MKKTVITTLLLFAIFGTKAAFSQTTREDFDRFRQQSQQTFREFQEQSRQEFEDFRARSNAEFAAFMEQSWEEFRVFRGIPAPPPMPPVVIPKVDPDNIPPPKRQPIDEVIPLPIPEPQPQPVAPIVVPPTAPEPPPPPVIRPEVPTPPPPAPAVNYFTFTFFGTECRVRLDNSMRFRLNDISERAVAQMWTTLSDSRFNALIADCLALRDRLNLSDWSYKLMLRAMTEQFFGANSNEAILLQMFLLTQSGYKVRIGRAGNRLVLLVPFRENLYGVSFFNLGGQRFYIMSDVPQGYGVAVFNKAFPQERFFRWQTSGLPSLAMDLTPPRTFTTASSPRSFIEGRPPINITIQTNRNLMNLLYTYPFVRWDMYVHAGLSEQVRQVLYPALQRAIAGKSNLEAVQILLDFHHHAFAYMTDCDQFGYEKPFFADENFFFPYNDCEDRAILFAILVRDLLGLEVVLLHYPNHLSTAVHFPEHVEGDHFMIDGRRFVEADPTFINARVGMTMPQFRGVSANVIRL